MTEQDQHALQDTLSYINGVLVDYFGLLGGAIDGVKSLRRKKVEIVDGGLVDDASKVVLQNILEQVESQQVVRVWQVVEAANPIIEQHLKRHTSEERAKAMVDVLFSLFKILTRPPMPIDDLLRIHTILTETDVFDAKKAKPWKRKFKALKGHIDAMQRLSQGAPMQDVFKVVDPAKKVSDVFKAFKLASGLKKAFLGAADSKWLDAFLKLWGLGCVIVGVVYWMWRLLFD